VRHPPGHGGCPGRPRRSGRPDGDRRSLGARPGRAVLRAAYRRSARRPATMVTETVGSMSARSRVIVLSISAPVIAFAIVGGFLGKVMAREDTYQHLRTFEEVTQLVTNNYVENVNVDKVMHGAMRGLPDSLDPDSAYLSPDEVRQAESGASLPAGDVGIDLTRQYYLRVVATRDNSSAAKAGLRTGDFIRMIGN